MRQECTAAVEEEMDGINETGQKSTPPPRLWAALGSPPREGVGRGLTGEGLTDAAKEGFPREAMGAEGKHPLLTQL